MVLTSIDLHRLFHEGVAGLHVVKLEIQRKAFADLLTVKLEKY